MENSSIKNVTRGGQIFLHNLRMITQVLDKVFLWSLPMGLLIGALWFWYVSDPYSRYVTGQWVWAKFLVFIDGHQHQQLFLLPNHHAIKVYSSQLLIAPAIINVTTEVFHQLTQALFFGLIAYGITIGFVVAWLRKGGDHHTAPKHIKGDYLGTVDEAKELMKFKKKLSDFLIGVEKLPIPLYSEQQHFLFHGTTGAGKSMSIKEFLDEIRRRGDRVILYDKSCSLLSEFFREGFDTLLNPLDMRGPIWGLWKECRDKADFESLSAALIPMPPSNQDPFWVNAARTIFAAAAHRMSFDEKPKILPLLRYLLTADIGELQSLLQGTEAESLMSEKAEKTAISIKSVLATYLKSLCFLADGDDAFSIRQWIQKEKGSDWLFITSQGDKHESLKPLITAWLDIAVNALLSLPPDPNRRIWIILDELASLQQLPYLTSALSEARKFGGCFVVGIQSYAQIAKVYGHEGAREISSLLNTRFMFREPDGDIAKWSAINLGESTIEEVREGVSYGANQIRDGVTVNRSERNKPLVSYSEIMNLDDLHCYVRLAGKYPIVSIEIPYVEREKIAEPFIPKQLPDNNLRREVAQMVERVSSPFTSKTASQNPSKDESKKNNASQEMEFQEEDRLFG